MNYCGDCDHYQKFTCPNNHYDIHSGSMSASCFESKEYEEMASLYDCNELPHSPQEEIKLYLKTKNSDGRVQCVACGRPIKEPYPDIRYCPRCES